MATDKRLDQVSNLTDFDYALIVKGTDVAKVTKQQLAELVGNLLYGATTKETLASVVAEQMGAFQYKRRLTASDDLNSIGDGIYCYVNTDNPNNTPNDAYNCIVIQFSNPVRGDKIQFVHTANAGKLYFRNCVAGTSWSDWKVITMS